MAKVAGYKEKVGKGDFFAGSKPRCSVCGGVLAADEAKVCIRCEDRLYEGADVAYEMKRELDYERLERLDPDFVSFD